MSSAVWLMSRFVHGRVASPCTSVGQTCCISARSPASLTNLPRVNSLARIPLVLYLMITLHIISFHFYQLRAQKLHFPTLFQLISSKVQSHKNVSCHLFSPVLAVRAALAQFLQSCTETHSTPSHPREWQPDFLTNCAACVDIPTAASKEYNLPLLHFTSWLFISFCFLDSKVGRFWGLHLWDSP